MAFVFFKEDLGKGDPSDKIQDEDYIHARDHLQGKFNGDQLLYILQKLFIHINHKCYNFEDIKNQMSYL